MDNSSSCPHTHSTTATDQIKFETQKEHRNCGSPYHLTFGMRVFRMLAVSKVGVLFSEGVNSFCFTWVNAFEKGWVNAPEK